MDSKEKLKKQDNQEKYDYLSIIDINMVKNALGKRNPNGHKGTFGTLFCLCGSVGMAGAAVMSSKAALRCGVGMVKCGVPKSIYNIVASRLLEAVFVNLEENIKGTISKECVYTVIQSLNKCTAILVGCGLGLNNDVLDVIFNIIKKSQIPMVIDADGINAVSRNINILKEAKKNIIITPHIGEMARLLDISIEEVIADRLRCAKSLSEKYGVITVLKGSETIISDEIGNLFINRVANSGMSKGGSGDVLAGMISSFLAQGFKPINATVCGVYLHSIAGLRCKDNCSETAMLPTDLIKELPNIFLDIGR